MDRSLCWIDEAHLAEQLRRLGFPVERGAPAVSESAARPKGEHAAERSSRVAPVRAERPARSSTAREVTTDAGGDSGSEAVGQWAAGRSLTTGLRTAPAEEPTDRPVSPASPAASEGQVLGRVAWPGLGDADTQTRPRLGPPPPGWSTRGPAPAASETDATPSLEEAPPDRVGEAKGESENVPESEDEARAETFRDEASRVSRLRLAALSRRFSETGEPLEQLDRAEEGAETGFERHQAPTAVRKALEPAERPAEATPKPPPEEEQRATSGTWTATPPSAVLRTAERRPRTRPLSEGLAALAEALAQKTEARYCFIADEEGVPLATYEADEDDAVVSVILRDVLRSVRSVVEASGEQSVNIELGEGDTLHVTWLETPIGAYAIGLRAPRRYGPKLNIAMRNALRHLLEEAKS